MDAFLVITFFISFLAIVIIGILDLCKIEIPKWSLSLCLALFVYSIVAIALYVNSPKPIDVYRGKTELKINGYHMDTDSSMTFIPTDSTVVFKN